MDIALVSRGPSVQETWHAKNAGAYDLCVGVNRSILLLPVDRRDIMAALDFGVDAEDPWFSRWGLDKMPPPKAVLCMSHATMPFRWGKVARLKAEEAETARVHGATTPVTVHWLARSHPGARIWCFGVDMAGDRYDDKTKMEDDQHNDMATRWPKERCMWTEACRLARLHGCAVIRVTANGKQIEE